MNQCLDYNCPNKDYWSGQCQLTACNRQPKNQIITLNETDAIIFPQTIGDITFYSKQELVKWVEEQQKMNEDPNYGIGNWC